MGVEMQKRIATDIDDIVKNKAAFDKACRTVKNLV